MWAAPVSQPGHWAKHSKTFIESSFHGENNWLTICTGLSRSGFAFWFPAPCAPRSLNCARKENKKKGAMQRFLTQTSQHLNLDFCCESLLLDSLIGGTLYLCCLACRGTDVWLAWSYEKTLFKLGLLTLGWPWLVDITRNDILTRQGAPPLLLPTALALFVATVTRRLVFRRIRRSCRKRCFLHVYCVNFPGSEAVLIISYNFLSFVLLEFMWERVDINRNELWQAGF